MSSANDLSASLNNFLSKAVEANVAPGLIAVAFNREGIFVSSPHSCRNGELMLVSLTAGRSCGWSS